MFKTLTILLCIFNLNAMEENDNSNVDQKYGDTPQQELADIHGLDKKEVLKALYNQAKPIDEKDILDEKYIQMAENKEWKVGRLQNKSLHVDLSNNFRFNAAFYNQANGENAAQDAIAQLKKQKSGDSADKK